MTTNLFRYQKTKIITKDAYTTNPAIFVYLAGDISPGFSN